MVKKLTLRGQDMPELDITKTFIEFYSLESVFNCSTQKNYTIIRLVTIVEQFCRDVMLYKLQDNNTFLDTIELKIPFIDSLIHAVSVEHRRISKEEIIAAAYPFQNTTAIQKEFCNAFKGLNKNDYEVLFKTRHKLIHTISEVTSLDTGKYYRLVERLMENILEKHHNKYTFYRTKIFALKKLKKNDELEQCYRSVCKYYKKQISKNHQNLQLYLDFATLLDRFEKYDESVYWYDEAIKLEPNDDWAYIMKAGTLENKGDLANAIKCYEQVIEMYPNDSNVYYNKGLALYESAEYNKAIEYFDKAIELDQNSSAYYMKGKSLYRLGYYQKSVDCFDRCIRLDTLEDPNVFLDYGLSLQKNGDAVKSIEYLVRSLFLWVNSDFHYTHKEYYSGIAWQGLGVHNIALLHFKKTLEIEPDYLDAYSGMGESLLGMKRYAESVEQFDNVLKVEPSNKRAQHGKKTALKLIIQTTV